MSTPSLSSEVQLRYLLQWFSEFSELQREDFLPVLAAAQQEKHDELANALAALNCQDKPVSLFQCRVKLFNDWYPTWSEEERFRLMKGVTEMDSDFAKKVQQCNIPNGTSVNGVVEEFGAVVLENGHEGEKPGDVIIEPVQEVDEPKEELKDDEEQKDSKEGNDEEQKIEEDIKDIEEQKVETSEETKDV